MCDDAGWASGWEVITSIRRFQNRMAVFMDESLEPLGMSFAQYRALETILANREIHLSELARLLRLSRQTVQACVRKLHMGDLVELVYEPGRVYVRVSKVGLRRLELARGSTRDFKTGIEKELSGAQRHQITALLSRIDRVLEPPRQPEWWLAP